MQQSEAEQALHRIERELNSPSPVKTPSNGGATAGRVEKTSKDAHLDAVVVGFKAVGNESFVRSAAVQDLPSALSAVWSLSLAIAPRRLSRWQTFQQGHFQKEILA